MDTTLSGVGPNENIELQVDQNQAGRFSPRPIAWVYPGVRDGGHFYYEVATGALTGVGALGPILSHRNIDANHVDVLIRAAMVYYLTTAYTTAQMNDFELVGARAWSAPDSGGAVVTPVKKRNTMGAPNSDIRVATTGALTAGTRTIDGAGVGVVADGPPNVAIPSATMGIPRQELVLYDILQQGGHPPVFDLNEGFIVRAVTAMGAVGVIKAYLTIRYASVPPQVI